MSLQHTRKSLWIFEQSVQGLVANLGKSTVCRGKEGERRCPVQDVSRGSVVEGCGEGSYEGGEAVVSSQSLVQCEGAGGRLGGNNAWGLREGGVGREGYWVIWKGYWVGIGWVRRKRDGIRIRWVGWRSSSMVDTCVLCECSRNLVAIWAEDLPDGAVEHIVHQVDLPARTKQLFCLR